MRLKVTWNVRRIKLYLWFQHNLIKHVEVGKNKEMVYILLAFWKLSVVHFSQHSTLFCEMKRFLP